MRIKLFMVGALIMGVTLSLCTVSFSQDVRKPVGKTITKQIDPAKHEVADVRPMLTGKKLKDGLNLINTSPQGLRLNAVVKQGEIVEWVVTNPEGQRIKTTSREAMTGKTKTCWECASDENGNDHCWKIPCPKRPKPKAIQ